MPTTPDPDKRLSHFDVDHVATALRQLTRLKATRANVTSVFATRNIMLTTPGFPGGIPFPSNSPAFRALRDVALAHFDLLIEEADGQLREAMSQAVRD